MRRPHGGDIAVMAAVLGVVAAVAGGLHLMGTPSEVRLERLDERRVRDLKRISRAVDAYRSRYGRLPATLDELPRQPQSDPDLDGLHLRDPATERMYGYHARGDSAYVLCAMFQRESAHGTPGEEDAFWSHGAGRHCFEIVAGDAGYPRTR